MSQDVQWMYATSDEDILGQICATRDLGIWVDDYFSFEEHVKNTKERTEMSGGYIDAKSKCRGAGCAKCHAV